LAAVGNDWLVGRMARAFCASGRWKNHFDRGNKDGVVVNPTAMVADGRVVLAGTLGQGLLVGDASGTRWRTVSAAFHR